jgi:hypothetical protein
MVGSLDVHADNVDAIIDGAKWKTSVGINISEEEFVTTLVGYTNLVASTRIQSIGGSEGNVEVFHRKSPWLEIRVYPISNQK